VQCLAVDLTELGLSDDFLGRHLKLSVELLNFKTLFYLLRLSMCGKWLI
jgi:hypothetical protein